MYRMTDNSCPAAVHLSLEARLPHLAAKQYGIFTREQTLQCGASRRMVRYRETIGRWEQVAPNVFRLAGTPGSWLQSLMIACLAWGPGAAISHCAAAALRHIARFDTGPVELTVPRGRKRCGPGTIHRNYLPSVDVTKLGPISVTTPERT